MTGIIIVPVFHTSHNWFIVQCVCLVSLCRRVCFWSSYVFFYLFLFVLFMFTPVFVYNTGVCVLKLFDYVKFNISKSRTKKKISGTLFRILSESCMREDPPSVPRSLSPSLPPSIPPSLTHPFTHNSLADLLADSLTH